MVQTYKMSEKHLSTGSTCPTLTPGLLRCYSMKFCPYAQRARLVLRYKNIKHETVNVHLKKKPEWFTEKFILAKVPILEIDDKVIYESLVTTDFLDELVPDPSLYPNDLWKKGQDKSLIQTFSLVTAPFYKVMHLPDDSTHRIALEAGLDYFERELLSKNTPYFSGNEPGMVDYTIWPWFERLPSVRQFVPEAAPEQNYPELTKWTKRMMNDPVVKSIFISEENHTKFLRSFVKGEPDYDMKI